MDEYVIDTNVAVVAGLLSDMSMPCAEACAGFMEDVLHGKHKFIIDTDYHLIGEYEHFRNDKNPYSFPHRFLKWVYVNQNNPKYCKQVKINEIARYEFAEIPAALKRLGIDLSDMKFIAVAFANQGKAPIVEASDSKWIGWENDLKKEGIIIDFLCKNELREKYNQKMKP